MNKLLFAFVALIAMTTAFEKTEYSFFKDKSHEEIAAHYLGLNTDYMNDTMLNMFMVGEAVGKDLPESFDWREEYAECVHPVRDQGRCGSCWAHAASEVLSDRFCIQSKGQTNVVFSPQQLVDCDLIEMGCSGGFLTTPLIYYSLVGGQEESCYGEYTSGKTGARSGMCLLKKWQCPSYHAQLTSIRWLMNPQAIKEELYANGPVSTGFMVYDDFMNYRSGIYKQNSDKLLGGHAVKIVGWGNDNGEEYWIVQNSWTTAWGEGGYFRIAFGQCNIDSGAVSVNPSL